MSTSSIRAIIGSHSLPDWPAWIIEDTMPAEETASHKVIARHGGLLERSKARTEHISAYR
jgi:hypothetical protein